MTGTKFQFVIRHDYNPEIYDILMEGKIVAELKTQYGSVEVRQYNTDIVLFDLQFNDEFIGSIPDNMKDDIFEAITNKLNLFF